MTNQRRIAVRGIIFNDGKLLSQQLKPDKGEDRDYWCTPGGGLETNESLYEGLRRELIEETGIAPKIGRLLFVQQFHHGDQEQMEFFFHIENPQDYETIDLSSTSHGEIEIDTVDFIDPAKNNILPAFLQKINIETYINEPQAVLIYDELVRSVS